MYGRGLLKGLAITIRHFFGRAITEQYPEHRPVLAPRFRGLLSLAADKCTACGTCASSCPNRAIRIHTRRDEKKRRLIGYEVNLLYCLFCGLCVEACPEGALSFSPDFELATYHRSGAIYTLYALSGEAAKTKAVDLAGQGEFQGRRAAGG
ncbi:MAG: NuoI/complex I 23 kDa subunit family protein [Moorellales bacterium]